MFTSKIKTANELSNNASKVLELFTTTISSLTKIVEDAETSISQKEEEIKAAQLKKVN